MVLFGKGWAQELVHVQRLQVLYRQGRCSTGQTQHCPDTCTGTRLSVSNTLATSLVTETGQTQKSKGNFFNFKRVSWPPPTSCRVKTPVPVSRARALAQVCWDMPAYSVSVASYCARLTQFYTHVLKKVAYQSNEHMALAGWKSPLLTLAVAYPQYVSTLIFPV